MKKKILLMLVMTVVLVLALAVAVSADSVHAGKVDLNQEVTLSDGTECALFDAEGNALIWFRDNTGALKSIRADIGITGESKVDYIIDSYAGALAGFSGVSITQIDRVIITYNGVTYDAKSIVVFNIMDDDVVVTSCTKSNYNGYIGKPVDSFQNLFSGATNIEYAFLRLDTVAIQGAGFNKATNLKYVNLEDLTQMVQIAGNGFYGCSSLGPDIVLPNSIINIGTACFRGCSSLETIRLGEKAKSVGSWDFLMDCPKLTTVYIPGTLTNITINSFSKTNNITEIFYVGTEAQANSFIESAAKSGGNGVIATLELISYTNYKAKVASGEATGKYFVYDYSYCEAFNKGVHELDPEKSNACAGICGVCGEASLAEKPVHDYVTTITYDNFLAVGIKTQTCQNAGCAHGEKTPYETEVNAIIKEFKGFSTPVEGEGLTFGYVIDYEALEEYVAVNGKSVELGLVVAGKALLDGKAPLGENGNVANEKVVKISVVTWSNKAEDNADIAKYTGVDFKITGDWTDLKDVEIYMAGYLSYGDGYKYLNAGGSSDTADYTTYNTIVNGGNPPVEE